MNTYLDVLACIVAGAAVFFVLVCAAWAACSVVQYFRWH